MSKYSLKFTTIKEWKPELLSPDENPDNPICLIINESQEAIAMLVPHVDNTFNESFIFHSESDTKTTTTLEVFSFQASSVSSKDIVQSSLKRGYSTTEAVAVTKAQNAYKNSAILTNDPTGVLSTCAYKVS